MMKKMFKSKNNLIITIVALLECILLLAITTYSWIESASSLRIMTQADLKIADGLNYEYEIKNSGPVVDLSAYFSETANFSFAQASSADGKTMFLQRTVTDADGKKSYSYRQGDTTDYNTTYYNIDFKVKNSTTNSVNYYFGDNYASMFSFADKELSNDYKDYVDKFLGAFRVAITIGNDTTIYSKNGGSYTAANSENETSTVAFAKYAYNSADNKDNENYLFQVTSDGKIDNINVKIWFEVNDSGFIDLSKATDETTQNALQEMLGAKIDVDLRFANAASTFNSFTFRDYTQTTSSDETNRMYFYDGNNAYPMSKVVSTTESDDETDIESGENAGDSTATAQTDYIEWVTCDKEDKAAATIPVSVTQALQSNYKDSYFFYGTADAENKPDTTVATWYLPDINTTNYTFKALSITPTSDDTTVGVGFWGTNDDSDVKAVQFVDKTTYNGDNAYNAGAYQFVSESENRLYISGSSSVPINSTPIMMLPCASDSDEKIYQAFVPANYLNEQINFYYTTGPFYKNNTQITWTANKNISLSEGEIPKYTAVGYSAKGKLSTDSFTSAGVGTWGETQRINLSAELIDTNALANTDYRFAINTNNANLIYMTTDSADPLTAYVYVPVSDSINQFYYYNETNQIYSNWAVGSSNSKNSENNYIYDTYYPTTSVKGVSTGYWNPVVLVDGTADNLIADTLSDAANTGASLTYTTNSDSDSKTMTQIDNYRWVTDDLGALSNKTVNFKWIAYTENADKGFVDTEFKYTFELVEGTTGIQYLVVTEAGSYIKNTTDN